MTYQALQVMNPASQKVSDSEPTTYESDEARDYYEDLARKVSNGEVLALEDDDADALVELGLIDPRSIPSG